MKYWNTVGSTGTVDESSQRLVVFDGAIARLLGMLPAQPVASQVLGQNVAATIRYGIPANLDPNDVWMMSVRFRDTGLKSRVVVRAYELDFPTGAVAQLGMFDSNAAGAAAMNTFQVQSFHLNGANFNNVTKCHYVEVELSMQNVLALPEASKAPAIAAISLVSVIG